MEDMVAVAMPECAANHALNESKSVESAARVYLLAGEVVVAEEVRAAGALTESDPRAARRGRRVVARQIDEPDDGAPPSALAPQPPTIIESAPQPRAATASTGAVSAPDEHPAHAPADEIAPVPRGAPAARIIEALLFSADAPVSLAKLAELAECGATQARLHVAELNDRYTAAGMSFRIEEIARGYQMMTLPEFAPHVARLLQQRKETRLGDASLETLSIIAYKQPIIRADVEAIRGVACGDVMKRLCEMGLARVVGRAEVVGRPLLYGTTRKFLDVFGLADLEDLPPMEALRLRAPAAAQLPASFGDAPAGEPPLAAAGA